MWALSVNGPPHTFDSIDRLASWGSSGLGSNPPTPSPVLAGITSLDEEKFWNAPLKNCRCTSHSNPKALRKALNLLSHWLGVVAMNLAPMDTLGAFSYLQDNLPAWISRITDLAAHTFAKYIECRENYGRQEPLKPRRPTDSCVRSVRPYKLMPIGQRYETNWKSAESERTIAKAKGSMGPIQYAGRKRRPDEDLPIDWNERFAFLNKRHKVIIEYDGHTQKVLEEVVQVIGICRSNIRRAKMSMMQTCLRIKRLDAAACLVNDLSEESDQSQVAALNSFRRIQTGAGMTSVTGSKGTQKKSAIDLADKHLELAHALCETAAYQALRSGDCSPELDSAVERFKKLLDMAGKEVRRLTEQKLRQTTEEETAAKMPLTSTAARLARVAAMTTRKPSTVGTSVIEVDDASSISAESVDRPDFLSRNPF